MENPHPALELFKELLVPSPSGFEHRLADVVRQKLDQLGFSHETDAGGNVLVRLAGRDDGGQKICFASHMDEIGMIVTRVHPDGGLSVDRSGGLQVWKLGEGPVEVFGDQQTITGILSMGSTHTSREGSDRSIRWDDCQVITGLSREQLKEAGVRVGSFALPVRERRGPVVFGDLEDPMAAAWTFDDRIGVVTLLRLLAAVRDGGLAPSGPTLFAFTVGEEIGGLGAKLVVRREQPDIFIAVDGSPMPPETDLKLDGRPGIWVKDRNAVYDPALVRDFIRAAEKAGTGLQQAVFRSTASDASLAAYGAGVARIACIGHVRENSHGYEVIRLSVLDNLLNTLVQFLKDWK